MWPWRLLGGGALPRKWFWCGYLYPVVSSVAGLAAVFSYSSKILKCGALLGCPWLLQDMLLVLRTGWGKLRAETDGQPSPKGLYKPREKPCGNAGDWSFLFLTEGIILSSGSAIGHGNAERRSEALVRLSVFSCQNPSSLNNKRAGWQLPS